MSKQRRETLLYTLTGQNYHHYHHHHYQFIGSKSPHVGRRWRDIVFGRVCLFARLQTNGLFIAIVVKLPE